MATLGHQRTKLEHICRYVARPAVSEKRLALTRNARGRSELKTPYRDGTTHVIFEPLDFMARLAALVPKPRVNLILLFSLYVWMLGFTLLNKQKVRFICTNVVQ